MNWTSIIAIYVLFWTLSAFLLLPFGVKTHDEAGIEKTPGQADSAPAHFRPGVLAIRATVLAAAFCALYVANYTFGWVSVDDINLLGNPPSVEAGSAGQTAD